jgi:hypothetical protein
MKNLFKLAIFAVLISLLSSCSIHSGFMNNSASLGEANFKYVHQGIYGTSQTFKVLGMGGFGISALVHRAKEDMMESIDLKSNQALVNVTVNWKKTTYILVTTNKCTVSADVVEFR